MGSRTVWLSQMLGNTPNHASKFTVAGGAVSVRAGIKLGKTAEEAVAFRRVRCPVRKGGDEKAYPEN